jgi:HEAT repeat protein
MLSLTLPAAAAFPDRASATQLPFEQTIADLASRDAAVRLKAVQALRDAAIPEAAAPLARLIADARDDIQLAAIAAELNIFVAERVATRKRIGLIVEVRSPIAAAAAFAAGPASVTPQPVPVEVLTSLRAASRDDNPRVALEALYAFGVLAVQPAGTVRRELLRASGPEIAALTGAGDPAIRYAAVRVMGRVFAPRPLDEAIEPTVGDAVITALNDGERSVKLAAMASLGAMRYARAVQALTDLFHYYEKGEAAEASLDALAHIASGGSVGLFSSQLAAGSRLLRAIAIEGLARSGGATRIADIRTAAAGDRADEVSLAAAFASVRLANGSLDPIVDALTRARLRERARAYLIELAPGRTESFRRHLMDPDPRIPLDVVGVLDVAGDPSALPLVEPVTRDKDPEVARAAERAAARLRATLDQPAK